MEKTEYIKPEMEIYEFETEDVIATSSNIAPAPADNYEGGGY